MSNLWPFWVTTIGHGVSGVLAQYFNPLHCCINFQHLWLSKGPFNNYVTFRGGRGVELCVTDHSQSNVKKRYEGGGRGV